MKTHILLKKHRKFIIC